VIPISPAAERRCRNCGASAPGAYCPSCGQETRERLPTLREFMREAAGRLVAFDGKLWKTLGALLFRPGFLTREYFTGRRQRHPARPRLYGEHLVFAAHNHAFLFLLAIASIAIPVPPLRTTLMAWGTIYMLWSLRVVYGGSWIGVLMRSFAMLIAYSVLFSIVTVGLLVAAVLLR
jgi:hypothetical protein